MDPQDYSFKKSSLLRNNGKLEMRINSIGMNCKLIVLVILIIYFSALLTFDEKAMGQNQSQNPSCQYDKSNR
jgi:hypothetical protein